MLDSVKQKKTMIDGDFRDGAAYLNKGDYNIIAVDWSRLARSPFYLTAASSTKEVGVATAQLIDFLVANTDGGTAKRFHVLGYSLGAHAAGWAGASLSVGTLSRITGDAGVLIHGSPTVAPFDHLLLLLLLGSAAFDPPFPGFEGPTGRRRLSRDDAAFVDVIHTAARPESARRGRAIGFETQLGHADFYPNGGSVQNGCLTRFIGLHRSQLAILFPFFSPLSTVGTKMFVLGGRSVKKKQKKNRCGRNGRETSRFRRSLGRPPTIRVFIYANEAVNRFA